MAQTTTDHKTIRQWIEYRGGVPATVEDTRADEDSVGVLRVDFPDAQGNDSGLTTIAWEQFFQKFEESSLAFLYEEKSADGALSRFSKFVSRDS